MKTKKEFTVSVQSQNAEIDTLYITESVTEKILAKVPLQGALKSLILKLSLQQLAQSQQIKERIVI